MVIEDTIRIAATLTLVLVGLAVVLIIFLWPLLLLRVRSWSIAWIATIEVIHISALVFFDYPYLFINRKAFLLIRKLLMPLVMGIAKSEVIREKEPTWYVCCKELPPATDTIGLLSAMKYSVRKDLKKKLRIYHERGITTSTRHSDYLSLKEDIPIIWEHEKRAVRGTDKFVVAEFIKRFLIVFLSSDAYIDRYYDQNGCICALGLFVASGRVLNALMYFCLEKENCSGIWQYNHFRSILRGAVAYPTFDYINFQVHQPYAKKCAGAIQADHTNTSLLNSLYPFKFFKEPPAEVISLKVDAARAAVQK